MTAPKPPLPQRTPGATLATAPDPDTCHLCRNRQPCDWHWAKRHISADDCACCYGRYSSCRNTTATTTHGDTT